MSVAPTSAAAALASTAAAAERASKVQTAAKESDQARRTRHGQQTADRIVLSVNGVQPGQSATDKPESDQHPAEHPSEHNAAEPRHIDVQG